MRKFLAGSGAAGKGGGGAGRVPFETPDSLSSTMVARVVDLIGEGPIEGFVDKDGNLLESMTFEGALEVYSDAALSISSPFTLSAYGNNPGPVRFSNGTNVFTVAPGLGGSGYNGTLLFEIVDDGYFDLSTVTDPAERAKFEQGYGQGAVVSATIVSGAVTQLTITNPGKHYVKPRLIIPSPVGNSILLNDIPVSAEDGRANFERLRIDYRRGQQSQEPLSDFPSAQFPVTIGVPLKYKNPYPIILDNDAFDTVQIGVSTDGAFFEQNKTNGDVLPVEVAYSIKVEHYIAGNLQSSAIAVTDTISGKSSSVYTRTVRVQLPKNPGADNNTWIIIVERLTPDSEGLSKSDKINLAFATAESRVKLSFPNCALVAVELDARTFQQIPRRGYRLKLLRVKVPVNYNPTTRAYTGHWDGTFKEAWTDNPAWIIYDMVNNERYGFGELLPPQYGRISKWDCYQIGKWCDELVSDGRGGQEPRYTCNVYFQSREEAFGVLLSMLSVFWGNTFFRAGSLELSYDHPQDPITHFTAANVYGGRFSYAGSPNSDRASVVIVQFDNPEKNYQADFEVVEDFEAISQYGIVESEIRAVGCTSRGQAHRYGRAYLFTKNKQRELVSFQTGLEASMLLPGKVFSYSDPARAGVRYGGRITFISADRLKVITDKKITPTGTLFKAILTAPSGRFTVEEQADPTFTSVDADTRDALKDVVKLDISSFESFQTTEEVLGHQQTLVSGVTNIVFPTQAGITYKVQINDGAGWTDVQGVFLGTGSSVTFSENVVPLRQYQVVRLVPASENLVLNFSSPIPTNVAVGGIWAIESAELQSQQAVCINIREIGKEKYEITGIVHYNNKWDYIENNLVLDEPVISNLPANYSRILPPTDLKVVVSSNRSGVSVAPSYKASLSWTRPQGTVVLSYNVYVKRGIADWAKAGNSTSTSFELDIAYPDSYVFRVTSVGLQNLESESAFTDPIITVVGSVVPPVDKINKLEIDRQGLDTVFLGSSFRIYWSVESTLIPEFGNEISSGVDTVRPAEMPRALVTIFDGSFLRELLQEEVTGMSFFVSEALIRGQLGNKRSYVIGVSLISFESAPADAPDPSLLIRKVSAPSYLRVDNPRPAVPVGPSIVLNNTARVVDITFRIINFSDLAGWRIWVSTAPFSNLATTYYVESNNNRVTISGINGVAFEKGITYYLRYAAFDIFAVSDPADCLPSELLTFKFI